MHLKAQKLINQNGIYLDGPLLIKPNVFKDERGFFMESWNKRSWSNLLEEYQQKITPFVQDNHSKSTLGVLRGLHYQKNPKGQGKLVRCIAGEIYDVAVDIRKNSPTYGKHFSIELNERNKKQLYIPVGFAHGFFTLEDNTIFSYKCSNYYHKTSEGALLWNDKDLSINWNVAQPVLSEKDKEATPFQQFSTPF